MLWKKIISNGYIPFTHVGNHHVEVEFVEPATAILGNNGSGKSSMLRLLNPRPATRTDFLKDGSVTKVFEHAGHIYTLTSDFSNATAPHSFKKDDVELNLSHTTDAQRDLVEEHLGWNQLIDDLMSGHIQICSMQKAQRKLLFSAAYPSDLSFVLEYHKKVCSQIRTYSNQIKLLQGREGSLISSMIEESERNRMNAWRDSALTILDRIDKLNFLLENEISRLKENPAYEYPDRDVSELHQQIKEYLKQFNNKLINYSQSKVLGEDLSKEALKLRSNHLSQEYKFLNEKKETIQKNLIAIRDELDKFTRIKNAPASDKKDDLSNELILIEQEMKSLQEHPDWQNAPSIQEDKLQIVTDLVPVLNELIASIHNYAGRIIGQEEITKLRSENDSINYTLNRLMSEKVGLEQQLASFKSRREMMTQNSYPKDCSRICGLRATLEASVRDIDLRCSEIEARLKSICSEMEKYQTTLNHNQKQLQEISPVLPIIKRLYDKLSENYLLDLTLDGESFLDCINNHCNDITNRIVKGIESSKIYYRYRELFNRSEAIKNTLSMMEANKSVNLSLDVIEDIIRDKQKKLDEGILDLDDLSQQVENIKKAGIQVEDIYLIVDGIEQSIKTIQDSLNHQIIMNRIKFDQQMISEHLSVKNTIGTKLREIEHTLEEQKRIIDILNTEIKPTLEDLRKQKLDWELLESGLSPTKGLPCIYLVRFMNRLISRANAIIKDIWYCDMELAYIDEKETLDFTISVILNKSTTVKDISLCSNGQKAIIDLAMTFAICLERGFLEQYPISLDEVDAALTPEHRAKLTQVLSDMLADGTIKQMFLVNHYAVQSGLAMCDVVSLSDDGIVLPSVYNEHAIITK